MAFNVSYLLELKDRFSSSAERAVNAVDKLRKRLKETTGAAKKLSEIGKDLRKFGGKLTLGLTAPIAAAGLLSLKTAADLEQLSVSFEVMLGSAEKAKAMMEDLLTFTAKTPFRLEGVMQSTKTLLAMGFAQEEIMGSLKTLGDISAGTGKPLKELAVIYGQIRGAGKLMGQDLLQLINAGVPIIQQLSKMTGKSAKEIRDAVSAGQVSFEDVKKAFRAMTGEGGTFFNLMEKQSRTLSGLWSTFADAISLGLAPIGQAIAKALNLSKVLPRLTAIVEGAAKAFARFAEEHPKLTKLIIVLTGIVAILGPLAVGIGLVAAAMAALSVPALIVIGVIALIAAGIAALIIYWDDLVAAMQNVADFWTAVFDDVVGNIEAKIRAITNAVKSAINTIGSFLGFGDDTSVSVSVNQQPIAAQNAQAMSGTLNGRIVVEAPNGGLKRVESQTSGITGDLGLNAAAVP